MAYKRSGFLLIFMSFCFCNVLMDAIAATVHFHWKISIEEALHCDQTTSGKHANKLCGAGPLMRITEANTIVVNITNSLSSEVIRTGCQAIDQKRSRNLSSRAGLHLTEWLLQPGHSFVDHIQVTGQPIDIFFCVAHITWLPNVLYGAIIAQPPQQQHDPTYQSPPASGEWWNANIEHVIAMLLASERGFKISDAPTNNEPLRKLYDCSGGGVDEESLSTYIWESSVDLLQEVYGTTYIKGVINGDMDLNFYGAYTMQDAAWCREISKIWGYVARNRSTPQELRHYANHSMFSYLACSQDLFNAFNIKDDGKDDYGVLLGPAAAKYANVVQSATYEYGSPYIMIATYACVKLWANITANLSTMVNSSNPYSLWVYNNTGNSSAIKQTNFIDKWASQWYDRSLSLSIFRNAMLGEIGLFNLEN